MMNVKEVLDALGVCTKGRGCKGCPYDKPEYQSTMASCRNKLVRDAKTTIEQLQEQLQNAIDADA